MKFIFVALVVAGSAPVGVRAAPFDVLPMQVPNISLAMQKIGFGLASINFMLYPWRSLPAHDTAVTGQAATVLPEKPVSREACDVRALIHAAAQKHQVPEAFVASIVAAESNFQPDAVSPKGAIGPMQLMPATAHEYGADPTIPEQNIEAGTRYLGCLMARYQKSRDPLPRVIAAYNAGPGAVDRYRGVPPFRETRRYVMRVLALLRRFQGKQSGDPARPGGTGGPPHTNVTLDAALH